MEDYSFLGYPLPEKIKREEYSGNFSIALKMIDGYLGKNIPGILKKRLEWEKERIKRIRYDYSLSKQKALEIIRKDFKDFRMVDLDKLLKDGKIDYKKIDGKTGIFRNFYRNLVRDNESMKVKRIEEKSNKANKKLHEHIENLKGIKNKIRFEITVNTKKFDDELLRVWIPFPVENNIQKNVKVLNSSHDYIISDSMQRTVYMEDRVKNEIQKFWIEYEYEISPFKVNIDPEKVKIKNLKNYLREQPPHVVFTDYLRKLAREIVGDEENAYFKAKKIYEWVTRNIKYELVPEYSTIENISEYAAVNFEGDCGVQAILFITLCRISGIPAKWQSGWYINPLHQSPHDWAQIHLEPYGWIFVDPSFGGHELNNEKYHNFYFGNIDAFRMVANEDMLIQFKPEKKFYRSDNVDNQRGEVETEKRNIYYDGWKYNLKLLSQEEF